MLLKDCKFVGAYHFTSTKVDKETKQKISKDWTSVSFEIQVPENCKSIGTCYKDLLMSRDRVPKGLNDHIGESCVVDYMNNFCNEILFR